MQEKTTPETFTGEQSHGNEGVASRGNADANRFNDFSRGGRGRRGKARFSNNWREDPNTFPPGEGGDGRPEGYGRGGGRRGGRGRGGRAGFRTGQDDNGDRIGEEHFPRDQPDGDTSAGQEQTNYRGRGSGGHLRGARGGRRGRGRGRGRGGFYQDRAAYAPGGDASAREKNELDAVPHEGEVDTRAVEGSDAPYSSVNQHRPAEGEAPSSYRGRWNDDGHRRNFRGGYANVSDKEGSSNNYRDKPYKAPQQRDVAGGEALAREDIASEPNAAPRRVQRAPHLRKNCHDESRVLELFEHHHKQSGISLDNYANIPVEMIPKDIEAIEDFAELNVEPALAANIERSGYKKPTPVQRYGIPAVMEGNDLMACAQTGSGKTAAFLIPVVQYILVHGVSPARQRVCYPIALVMAPTRELALQIFDEVRKLTFRTDIFHDVIYGGTPYPSRFENDILVACPGRLKDIFDRGSLSFAAIKFLILDEADRMLEMGFEEQIEYLVASRYTDMPNPDNRQTLMFSATFPQRILNLAKRYLRRRYYLLTVGRVGSTTKSITQVLERVTDAEKVDRLFELIYAHKKTDLVLVFVETKRAAEDLHRELMKENIPSATIHGDRRQQEREMALTDFKSGETPILVATDVASRGLDIPNVAHVIQFDLPKEMDDYTHRIGRTGRAGNKGTATSFYTRNNRKLCVELLNYLSEHEQEVPSWLKQEVEAVEGEAMLSRNQGVNMRRGGQRREEESNSTWGDASGPRARTRAKKNAMPQYVDDGGF